MTLDGVLAGAVVLAAGIMFGYWLSDQHHAEIDETESEFAKIIRQQETRAQALEQYIRDYEKGEAGAEDLGWGQG